MSTFASSRLSKRQPLRYSSRSRPLNDSIQAFCQGDPGSMKAMSVSLNRHQSGNDVVDELGPVLEAHVGRSSSLCHHAVEASHHPIGVDGAPTSMARHSLV